MLHLHAEEPSAEVDDATQSVHTVGLDAPFSVENVPAAHIEQTVDVVFDVNEPAGQSEQESALASLLNDPGRHDSQVPCTVMS